MNKFRITAIVVAAAVFATVIFVINTYGAA